MLLRPMRPSSAVGICPFPGLSILALQDDNYYSPCVRCTRAAGLWTAYLYLYRLEEMYSVVPPIQGSSKLKRCIPDRGAEHSVWPLDPRATGVMFPCTCLSSLSYCSYGVRGICHILWYYSVLIGQVNRLN